MRGLKRKVPLEKIEKKESRAVAFSKRRQGLYSEASELCLMSGSQIAILATPISSNSKVSFFSFAHFSVDAIVAAFLSNQRPRGLGFWWEDESLAESEDPEELSDAINSMSTMMTTLLNELHSDDRRGDLKKMKIV